MAEGLGGEGVAEGELAAAESGLGGEARRHDKVGGDGGGDPGVGVGGWCRGGEEALGVFALEPLLGEEARDLVRVAAERVVAVVAFGGDGDGLDGSDLVVGEVLGDGVVPRKRSGEQVAGSAGLPEQVQERARLEEGAFDVVADGAVAVPATLTRRPAAPASPQCPRGLRSARSRSSGSAGPARTPLISSRRHRCPEIHLFDKDLFQQHNAFRGPGAAAIEDLRERLTKVEY